MEVAVFRRPLCMVSRAWYPSRVECCVSVSRAAQLRRSLLLFIDALLQILIARQKLERTPDRYIHRTPDRYTLRTLDGDISQTPTRGYPTIQNAIERVWQEQSAPETPMPDAPLVRVLETFDLSSTDVEHFLDSKADLKALVPNSVTGTLQKHI